LNYIKKQKQKQDKNRQKELKIKYDLGVSLKVQFQILINEIVRLIDYGQNCISCEKNIANEKHDAGHLFPVSSNCTIRYNLLNIYSQCTYCNHHLGGNQVNYLISLQKLFTEQECKEIIELPQKHKELKLMRHELQGAIEQAKKIKKWLKEDNKTLTITQRIEYRKEINNIIGIYGT
jgi:hypothetical protein